MENIIYTIDDNFAVKLLELQSIVPVGDFKRIYIAKDCFNHIYYLPDEKVFTSIKTATQTCIGELEVKINQLNILHNDYVKQLEVNNE